MKLTLFTPLSIIISPVTPPLSPIMKHNHLACVVWHSSLAKQDSKDIERVQKAACKVILKEYYEDYDKALKLLRLKKLKDRRQNLFLNFAKNCLKNKKSSIYISSKN